MEESCPVMEIMSDGNNEEDGGWCTSDEFCYRSSYSNPARLRSPPQLKGWSQVHDCHFQGHLTQPLELDLQKSAINGRWEALFSSQKPTRRERGPLLQRTGTAAIDTTQKPAGQRRPRRAPPPITAPSTVQVCRVCSP
ncbi:unnamed protein product [Cuscuta europaea]|uniref:Uncharacterized protein n=1 Tax=Cuscuta europaea TaxID=41803 RepID=A0A9P1EMN3_CUSEU|nr:unnamed protein product [Cuscuta europaea]